MATGTWSVRVLTLRLTSYGNLAVPNSADAYDSLADGYAKVGMWKDAARASDRAVALATEFDHPNRSYFIEQAKKMNDRLKQKSENPK